MPLQGERLVLEHSNDLSDCFLILMVIRYRDRGSGGPKIKEWARTGVTVPAAPLSVRLPDSLPSHLFAFQLHVYPDVHLNSI